MLKTEVEQIEEALSTVIPNAQLGDFTVSAGQLPGGAKMYLVNDQLTGQELLESLRSVFPNKHLYVDFWAVWCGPCIEELSPSAELHTATKDLPIEFIYLCTSSGGQESTWKNLIAKYEVPGNHLFVNQRTHSELMSIFGKHGYPSYLLLSPDGSTDLDVGRPSANDRESILRKIGGE